jgi:DNA-binding response OmpR family regulator
MSVQQLHILVIDDNEDILFMLQAMLRHKGYKVSIKENPNEVEAAINDLSPAIILMDMLLSGADGREICTKLKSNPAFSAIPIVMLSAHPHARTECLAAGADYFLEKPFEMSDLFQTVSTAESNLLKK